MPELVQVDDDIRSYLLELALRLALFFLGAVISPLVGRALPRILRRAMFFGQGYIPFSAEEAYDRFIKPFQNALAIVGTLSFLAICLNLLVQYEELYTFLGFFVYLALSGTLAWVASKLARRVIRQSVINLMQRWVGEVNEVVLVFETLIYVIIALFAVVIFAQGLRLNLFALGASLGIGGIAVAFGAQQALGRLIGTLELYLDRPYLPGEYIRVNFNPYGEDVYGRVESIGLRSTKIRTLAQNTLIVVPNSLMAGKNIENISRGKKIMAMLCLDFERRLKDGEQALVKQTIEETSKALWGLDKTSARVHFTQSESQPGTRARVSFFITGSSENSISLRKRLLELANETIAKKLATYGLIFTAPEPTIYIDSPMTI